MRVRTVLATWVLLGALMSGCWTRYVVGIIYEDVPPSDSDVSNADASEGGDIAGD